MITRLRSLLQKPIKNNAFKNFNKNGRAADNKLSNSTGQAAVILIFIAAVCLIVYAVVLNLGRVSQAKTMTVLASDYTAGQLASYMASYGESILTQQLDQSEVCVWTGVAGAIIAIILLIISWGQLWPVVAVFLMALAVANLALQAFVVNPGFTSAWNKMISENLSLRDQFSESAVQGALISSVTDSVLVPDVYDYDGDRVWGFNGTVPKDKAGRFSIYYTQRLSEIKPAETVFVEDFLAALHDFLYKTTSNPLDPSDPSGLGEFGLFDKLPGVAGHECAYNWASNPIIPSECNPCCIGTTPLPECCDCVSNKTCLGEEYAECGVTSTCGAQSPYGAVHSTGTTYKNVYDAGFEDRTNNVFSNPVISFREALGKDDEHRLYFKNPLNPAGPQTPHSFTANEVFSLNDATSYFGFPFPDINKGIFPFFYKIADWGFDLNQVSAAVGTLADPNNHCHWCDGDPAYGRPECSPGSVTTPFGQTQLSLPIDPTGLFYNTTPCVDGVNNNAGNAPPLAADKAVLPGNIIADDNICAQDMSPYDGLEPSQGFWKRGSDRFCSRGDAFNEWPYFADCAKYGPADGCLETGSLPDGCDCANAQDADCSQACQTLLPVGCNCQGAVNAGFSTAGQWPEDALDDMSVLLGEFYELAQYILAQDPKVFAQNIIAEYNKIAEWIEPQGPDSAVNSPEVCVVCDEGQAGWLRIMHEWIKDMRDRLVNFRDTSFEGANCEDVWCVPPQTSGPNFYGVNECYNMGTAEAGAFDANNNGIRGDMEDIIACLNWNIEDAVTIVLPAGGSMPAAGNAEKFDACSETCTMDACSGLPRSMIPYPPQSESFEPELFEKSILAGSVSPVAADEPHLPEFLKCLWECSDANCQNLPVTRLSSGKPYLFTNPPSTFDEAVDCSGTGPSSNANLPNDPWFTEILDSVNSINILCDWRADSGRPWLLNVRKSAAEAENQAAKFKARRDFLQARLDELDGIISVLNAADNAFYNFLTCDMDSSGKHIGPACEFIQKVKDFQDKETGLPYQAIYGWRDDPPSNRPLGYWHVVKADVRLPGKCDKACGPYQVQTGTHYPWPSVKTAKEGIGLRKCYFLGHYEGVVKVRVVRYDENRDSNVLRFPNGEPIWDFKFFHPERGSAYSPVNLDIACPPLPDPLGLPAGVSGIYEGAYMLSERKETGGPDDNTVCWDRNIQLLSQGVMTETCARYGLAKKPNSFNDLQMTIQFIPCKNF